MSKVAILFPGQGSQFINMGADFKQFESYNQVQSKLFELMPETEKALAGELDINQTYYAQPLLFANQAGILEVIKGLYQVEDYSVAGFSLGEYSAYYASDVYDLDTGLKVIQTRSQVMDSVSSTYSTKIVLGLTKDKLTTVVSELNSELTNKVIISNYNLEKQLLINFEQDDYTIVIERLKNAGAKRILDLAVSGPFHTKIYAEAANQFQQYIGEQILNAPNEQLYLNLTGRKYNGEDLAVVMHDQMISGVQWKTEIESMIEDGVETFIELGSKSVVSNMVKKINRKVNIITIENVTDLDKLEDVWNKK